MDFWCNNVFEKDDAYVIALAYVAMWWIVETSAIDMKENNGFDNM